jgi:hypothetical protein
MTSTQAWRRAVGLTERGYDARRVFQALYRHGTHVGRYLQFEGGYLAFNNEVISEHKGTAPAPLRTAPISWAQARA